MAVVVVSASGERIAVGSADGAATEVLEQAENKAYSSALLQVATHQLARGAERPAIVMPDGFDQARMVVEPAVALSDHGRCRGHRRGWSRRKRQFAARFSVLPGRPGRAARRGLGSRSMFLLNEILVFAPDRRQEALDRLAWIHGLMAKRSQRTRCAIVARNVGDSVRHTILRYWDSAGAYQAFREGPDGNYGRGQAARGSVHERHGYPKMGRHPRMARRRPRSDSRQDRARCPGR